LLESNVALASSLQKTEARLVHQRAETQSRLLALRALEQQHKSKIVETEDALRSFSPMALYQRLNASVQEQEALVKGIEESFLDEGGVSTDRELADFIRRVREAKKLAFLRAQRKERWDEGRVGGWR
jgi:predicted  nucleic acid-binding Zn-ribbon protein